jgi:N-acetylmuramoyl-L-alanine amidase
VKKLLIIDAGHGGTEFGAVALGKREKDLNLEYATKLHNLLKDHFTIIMTRTEDKTFKLNDRCKFIASKNPDLVLSCHLNAFDGNASGTETIYSINADDKVVDLAKKLGSNISKKLALPLRRVFKKTLPQNGNSDYYALHRKGDKNTIILEPLFMDNKSDATLLFESKWSDRLAGIITDTVMDFYNIKYNKKITPTWKDEGELYMFENGYTKQRHNPNEIVDFGILGTILKNYTKKIEEKRKL